jgi:hypothetical protein
MTVIGGRSDWTTMVFAKAPTKERPDSYEPSSPLKAMSIGGGIGLGLGALVAGLALRTPGAPLSVLQGAGLVAGTTLGAGLLGAGLGWVMNGIDRGLSASDTKAMQSEWDRVNGEVAVDAAAERLVQGADVGDGHGSEQDRLVSRSEAADGGNINRTLHADWGMATGNEARNETLFADADADFGNGDHLTSAPELTALLATFDADGDGALSRSERADVHAAHPFSGRY